MLLSAVLRFTSYVCVTPAADCHLCDSRHQSPGETAFLRVSSYRTVMYLQVKHERQAGRNVMTTRIWKLKSGCVVSHAGDHSESELNAALHSVASFDSSITAVMEQADTHCRSVSVLFYLNGTAWLELSPHNKSWVSIPVCVLVDWRL